ncbi:MAG: HD domain-containing protein, partial [Akkermansiaceae bacterium]|nr:HD domain-containing protein [Akkermansiaceae bacterium]
VWAVPRGLESGKMTILLANPQEGGMLGGVTHLAIAKLKEQAGEKPLAAAVLAQLQSRQNRVTKTNKPYLELAFADATGSMSFKVWSDAAAFKAAAQLEDAAVVRLEGHWTQGAFGIDARELQFAAVDAADREAFFAGDPELLAKQDADFAVIVGLCESIADPRLRAVSLRFLEIYGERFRRTAAARRNHHARRGGLVEHVAPMMRAADALCGVYPELNRCLLLAGALLHDAGKLWENSYLERGFDQQFTRGGELLGHIPLGIELANSLFREVLETPEAEAWKGMQPSTEECRLHLLHLIASHHGEYEFGSPTLPKVPEAYALHYIDNLDAKLEMVRDGYARGNEVAPGSGIYERAHPLPAGLVKPLARGRSGPPA